METEIKVLRIGFYLLAFHMRQWQRFFPYILEFQWLVTPPEVNWPWGWERFGSTRFGNVLIS